MLIQLATVILPIGFIIHLLFRGIWVSLIGFSYVFPDGIKTENLNYPEKYNEFIKKSKDPVKTIIKLEKTCSLIYTFTFLFFFILIAIFNFFLITGLFLSQIDTYFGIDSFTIAVSILFYTIGTIYAFDFFTGGLIKKSTYFSRVYYPFYKVINFITFARLYRTQYYTLFTRYNKAKTSLVLFSIVIIYFLLFFTFQSKKDRRILYSDLLQKEYSVDADKVYENLIPEGDLIREVCIQSDIIKDTGNTALGVRNLLKLKLLLTV
jgi:hypothetical protein